MADIIQLLPDSIANQIAAGEVIQRPASVVKELLENSIDAGSSEIQLILKDGGKQLIQVIDNGCGMSETDARLCFERHATSKIRNAADLFAIRTMGFRGEAMASIAAIAHVEMKTRLHDQEMGIRLVIEGSEVKTQEPCQTAAGTSLAIKNLFYNVPARRNFLKSHTVEMRHVIEEFQHIAIANPEIKFLLYHNDNELFHLPKGNTRQRIVSILGNNYNKRLVPVEEETDVLKLTGFIGKPEFAKKSRGEQMFFVNNRFIKSAYLNHAIVGAYEDILPKDAYPLYYIFMDIDPKKIDINVHPTKQEIKFEDEKVIYNYLKVAVKHALGKHSITPTLDFETNSNFGTMKKTPITISNQQSSRNSSKSGISTGGKSSPGIQGDPVRRSNNIKNWEKLYEDLDIEGVEVTEEVGQQTLTIESKWGKNDDAKKQNNNEAPQQKNPYQVHNKYIVSPVKSGFLLIDQQAAHERILFEKYLDTLKNKRSDVQTELFPETLTLTPSDAAIFREILPQVNILGFDIQEFGNDSFIVHGVPADLESHVKTLQLIETLIDQFKENVKLEINTNENIARSMAKSSCIKFGQSLHELEMEELIDKLFACELPYKSPSGRNCFILFDNDELNLRFNS